MQFRSITLAFLSTLLAFHPASAADSQRCVYKRGGGSLIKVIKSAQSEVRAGEARFSLLAGSFTNLPAITQSPRKIFLSLNFDEVNDITALDVVHGAMCQYRLSLLDEKNHGFLWMFGSSFLFMEMAKSIV